jgi:hypothetical protein
MLTFTRMRMPLESRLRSKASERRARLPVGGGFVRWNHGTRICGVWARVGPAGCALMRLKRVAPAAGSSDSGPRTRVNRR